MFRNLLITTMLLFLGLMLGGCASNVFFLEAANNPTESETSSNHPNTVSLYIDAFGNLYPQGGYSTTRINEDLSGSLYDQSVAGELCRQADNTLKPHATLLCQSIEINECDVASDACFPSDKWQDAQSQLWQQAGLSIYQQATEQNANQLFFLIHGFNNTVEKSRPMFNRVKDEVSQLTVPEQKLLFVEIYWDGFDGIPLSGAWGSAQYSGPLVGLNLRQLFRGIKDAYADNQQELPDVSVFTHSSGAFVIGATLGDPYYALPKLKQPTSPEYSHFSQVRQGNNPRYPIPNFPSMTVGMVAAATPSETFKGATEETPEAGVLAANTTLIFTLNHRDFALIKGLGLSKVNALGVTSAGADKALYCKDLHNLKHGKVNTYAFDFAHSKEGIFDFWDDHGVESYLKHTNKVAFLQSILGQAFDYQALCPLPE